MSILTELFLEIVESGARNLAAISVPMLGILAS